MFVCSCDTIYCEHCAKALANLENVCWACDAPMDKTKPVKRYEEEEISDVTQKKLK
jgi:predicted amidophosphoribosyltransferase